MRSELTRLLRNQPFIPFTIRAYDGRSFDIKHVDFCMVTQNAAYISNQEGDEAVRLVFVAITSLNSKEPAV